MWIVCQVKNSHKMLLISLKNKNKKKKKECCLLQILISPLKVKHLYQKFKFILLLLIFRTGKHMKKRY